MNNSILDDYEKQLLALVPNRVIPKKQDAKIREMLNIIERVAKNHGMSLKTYLLVLGFRCEDDVCKKAKEEPLKDRLLEIYPHKVVYQLAQKDKELYHKLVYLVSKNKDLGTLNDYIKKLGFKVSSKYTLNRLLNALDSIAIYRIIVFLPQHREISDMLQKYLTKQNLSITKFFKLYHYKNYEALKLSDLDGFTEDMVVEVLRRVSPIGEPIDKQLIPPAFIRHLKKISGEQDFDFNKWLHRNQFVV